jgi:hypothetical protein
MGHEKQPANAPCLRRRIGPHRSVGCVLSVLPATRSRKRGEVVRTRTTILQAHTHQWLGSFGNEGLGQYREELRRAVAAIQRYTKVHAQPVERVLLRLDGQYGNGAIRASLAGLTYVIRGKDYQLLDR